MTMGTSLSIMFKDYNGSTTMCIPFNSRRAAKKAYDTVAKAIIVWAERTNDRMEFVELHPATGPFTLSLSDVRFVAIDDIKAGHDALAARKKQHEALVLGDVDAAH